MRTNPIRGPRCRPPWMGSWRLLEAGWDTDVTRRPHGQRITVVVHLDVTDKLASLHLGPLFSDADRRYLTCDATCEAWFERDGQPIGSGRTTRQFSRRLRRALEHRDRTCAFPPAGQPVVCTPITSDTGRTAGRPSWTTRCCSVHITIGCITAAVITITGPQTACPSLDRDGQELVAHRPDRDHRRPDAVVAERRGPPARRRDDRDRRDDPQGRRRVADAVTGRAGARSHCAGVDFGSPAAAARRTHHRPGRRRPRAAAGNRRLARRGPPGDGVDPRDAPPGGTADDHHPLRC